MRNCVGFLLALSLSTGAAAVANVESVGEANIDDPLADPDDDAARAPETSMNAGDNGAVDDAANVDKAPNIDDVQWPTNKETPLDIVDIKTDVVRAANEDEAAASTELGTAKAPSVAAMKTDIVAAKKDSLFGTRPGERVAVTAMMTSSLATVAGATLPVIVFPTVIGLGLVFLTVGEVPPDSQAAVTAAVLAFMVFGPSLTVFAIEAGAIGGLVFLTHGSDGEAAIYAAKVAVGTAAAAVVGANVLPWISMFGGLVVILGFIATGESPIYDIQGIRQVVGFLNQTWFIFAAGIFVASAINGFIVGGALAAPIASLLAIYRPEDYVLEFLQRLPDGPSSSTVLKDSPLRDAVE